MWGGAGCWGVGCGEGLGVGMWDVGHWVRGEGCGVWDGGHRVWGWVWGERCGVEGEGGVGLWERGALGVG